MALTSRDELVILRDRALDMIEKGAKFDQYSVEWPECPFCRAKAWIPLLSPYCYHHTVDLRGGTRDCLTCDPQELLPYNVAVVIIPN